MCLKDAAEIVIQLFGELSLTRTVQDEKDIIEEIHVLNHLVTRVEVHKIILDLFSKLIVSSILALLRLLSSSSLLFCLLLLFLLDYGKFGAEEVIDDDSVFEHLE